MIWELFKKLFGILASKAMDKAGVAVVVAAQKKVAKSLEPLAPSDLALPSEAASQWT